MPDITNTVFAIGEDAARVFPVSDFIERYSDPEGDFLFSIRITSAPQHGALLLGNVPVSAGYTVTLTDIAAGLLRFVPLANTFGAGIDSFAFVAVDVTADEDATPSIFSFDVMAVNDAPTFRIGDGSVSTSTDQDADDVAKSVRVQADGTIVVAGSSVRSGAGSDFAVVCYTPDGNLDLSFSDDGKVTTTIGTLSDDVAGMALQPDGKIVVAGLMVKSETDSDFAVVRYDQDGSPDLTFSSDGQVTTSMGPRSDYATAIAVQPDGNIVVSGYTVTKDDKTDSDFAVVRYHADGSLDKSFSSDGKTTTSPGTMVAEAYGMALQSDGKIVVAGFVTQSATERDFALVRYDTAGTLDKTFSGDGKVTTSLGGWHDVALSLAVQDDGKIVVAGYSFVNETDSDFALVRYNADGTLDTGFDGDGMVTTHVGSSGDRACRLAVLGDGRILVAGYAGNTSDRDIALVRYDATGSLDTTFGGDGMVITHAGTIRQDVLDMVVQPDGKIVVATSLWNGSDNDFMVVRYNPDGTPDRSFDPLDTLGSTVSYVEGNGAGVSGTPVVLDADVQIFDVESESAGGYDGAALLLSRQGGADADDLFFAEAAMGALAEGSDLVIGSTVLGTVSQNSGGSLQLLFGAGATGELVNQLMQSIAYANVSDAPPSQVVIEWIFIDSDTVNPLRTTGSTTVTINAVNDSPTSTDAHVSTASNAEKMLAITDFGVYDDPEGSPMSAVKITALPERGTLAYSNNGTTWYPVIQDQVIDSIAIEAGHLKYVPQASQTPVTAGFQVSDGSLFSDSAYTLTIDVQEPQYMEFGITIAYWNHSEGIEGVTAKLTDNATGIELLATDDGNGEYGFTDLSEGEYTLTAERTVTGYDAAAIDIADARTAFDLVTGNADGPIYQLLAADVNRDEQVGFRDVAALLRMGLHRQSAPATQWVIVPASNGSVPMDNDKVIWPESDIPVTLDQNKDVDLVGVLLGDVDGSWSAQIA